MAEAALPAGHQSDVEYLRPTGGIRHAAVGRKDRGLARKSSAAGHLSPRHIDLCAAVGDVDRRKLYLRLITSRRGLVGGIGVDVEHLPVRQRHVEIDRKSVV